MVKSIIDSQYRLPNDLKFEINCGTGKNDEERCKSLKTALRKMHAKIKALYKTRGI